MFIAHRITIPTKENKAKWWRLPCILFAGSPVEYPLKYIHLPNRYSTPAPEAARGYASPAVKSKLRNVGRVSKQFWWPRCTQLKRWACSFVTPSPSDAYRIGYLTPYFLRAFMTPIKQRTCCIHRIVVVFVSVLFSKVLQVGKWKPEDYLYIS